jgi:hypothetical protein
VIQRTIDGIFYTSKFGLIKPLTKVSNFDELVNQPRLTSLGNDIKESKGNNEKTDALLQDISSNEIGFPSSKWHSDHIPVGAILSLEQNQPKDSEPKQTQKRRSVLI